MAETGLNVKMGVSGLSKFRQDIKSAKSSMKTLEEALKLTEKEFKATGDREKYMTEKSQLLNVKLETQKTILAKAEAALKSMADNGVDKASTAFQTMQQEVLKAKQNLVDTETEIKNLGTDTASAAQSADDLSTNLTNVSKISSFDAVIKGIDSITAGIENASKKAFKLGQQFVKAALGAGSWADDLKTEADKWGISTDQLQRMQMTAQIIDTDVDTILAAQQKLRKAATGSSWGDVEEILGIKLDGQSSEDLFWQVGDAIMNLGDEYKKEEAAQAAFGKSWRDLIPLFKAGREEYEKTNESWTTVSEEQVEALGDMNDEYTKLQTNLETLKKTALAEFAEPLKEAMTAINGLLAEFNEWLKSEEGQAFVQNVIGALKDGLNWIVENKGTVVTAIGAIAAAFGGLKIASGTLKFLEMIQGFKGLGAGAGAAANAAGAASGAGASAAGSAASAASAGGVLPAVAGYGGLALIGSGFIWASDRRNNNREEVRGTSEYMQAQSAGAESILVDYLKAQQAFGNLSWESTAEEVDAAQARIDAAMQKLEETEGGIDALKAYNDWRQENSFGSDYWEIPEELLKTANDQQKALAESMDTMNKTAESMTSIGETMTQSMVTSEDIATLTGLPAEVAAAVRSAMANVKIYIDGQQAGTALAGPVGAAMGGILATYRK